MNFTIKISNVVNMAGYNNIRALGFSIVFNGS